MWDFAQPGRKRMLRSGRSSGLEGAIHFSSIRV
jgi:hypothetical protein